MEKRPVKEKNRALDKGAYGYRYFDIEIIEAEDENGITRAFKSEHINVSPWYIYGEEYTLKEIKEKFPEHRILITNMEINRIESVVRTEFGQFLPVEEDWVILKKKNGK